MPDTAVKVPQTLADVLRGIAQDIRTYGFYEGYSNDQRLRTFRDNAQWFAWGKKFPNDLRLVAGESDDVAPPDVIEGCCCVLYNPTVTDLRVHNQKLNAELGDFFYFQVRNPISWSDKHTRDEVLAQLEAWADQLDAGTPF